MIGKTLAHDRIVEKTGAGGMGEVYSLHIPLSKGSPVRRQILLAIMALTLGVALTVGCGGPRAVDIGDGSVGNLWWGVGHHWAKGDQDEALAYADKLVELHGAEAREMQASLSDYPPTDPPEATYKYQALNGVGFALWAQGEILLEKGDKAGAVEAFTSLVQDYGYAQSEKFDSAGEWWKPAESAREKLAELQSDTDPRR